MACADRMLTRFRWGVIRMRYRLLPLILWRRKIRMWLSVLIGLVLFSRQDILLWGTIFEPDELWQYIGIYHRGWFVMLWALMLLGLLWNWPDCRAGLLHAAMLYTLAFGGLPDVLYYWLRGLPIPELLPWLDAHPLIWFSPVTRWNLVGSVLIWMGVWLGVTVRRRLPI